MTKKSFEDTDTPVLLDAVPSNRAALFCGDAVYQLDFLPDRSVHVTTHTGGAKYRPQAAEGLPIAQKKGKMNYLDQLWGGIGP